MTVFDAYARYYDLLYRDKDYTREAAYVTGLIREHVPAAQTLLDLGSGTGIHAEAFAREGLEVHGVDRSPDMVAAAERRAAALDPDLAARLSFSEGDIRDVRLDRRFDAICSLFHVVSYQSTNEDLRATFETAARHLEPGGVFVFDCWYGPAVLTDRPEVRVKRLNDGATSVVRTAKPVLHPAENLVDVHYQLMVRDETTGATEEINETHRMRYLFSPEVALLLGSCGLELVGQEEWLSGRQPGFDTWGVCFVGRRKAEDVR